MAASKSSKLGQLASTAICGNDITSSCLYVSALAIFYAGRWAPVCLLLVAGTLYLFRSIYAEVVGALPLNGGAYNALLNTTSKFRASIAACLTILSYIATAVISSSEAMHYLHSLWQGFAIIPATIGLLAVFLVLTILGITESSRVAIGIFLFHLVSMTLLLVLGVIAIGQFGFDTLWANLAQPHPGGFEKAIFFGFAAAMLGISGFESSANFVEEQAEGVFPKTLRNMWIAVTVLNPGMAILALALVPMPEIREAYQNDLLSHMGSLAGGDWLKVLIGVDAVLVLSGATLTSYVGVTGLVDRMTLDRCLPQFLLKKNRRGTPHRIIAAFFLLSVSILLITRGDLKSLAAVYTLAFLSVMALFAIGNLLLKVKRRDLPRPTRASWASVLLALVAVGAALWGNARLNQRYLIVFLEYLIPTILVVTIMLTRAQLLQLAVLLIDEGRSFVRQERREAMGEKDARSAARWTGIFRWMNRLEETLQRSLAKIQGQQFVYFTRGDHVENLNRVMLYVVQNEHTNRVKIVNVYASLADVPPLLADHVRFLDEVYPEIDMELVTVPGKFSPELIDTLSKEWEIPKNLMFIGTPTGNLKFDLKNLGGVRLIV
jgi:amino acid transporter